MTMDAKLRIGLLLETGDPEVETALPPEGFETELAGPDEVVVHRAASWTGPDALDTLENLGRDERLDRLAIAGPSPGAGLLPDWLDSEAAPPRAPITWAAVREQCVWVEGDPEARTAKTRRLLEMAVARARGTRPYTLTTVAAERTVAVAGNNHAALHMAAALLEAGFPVILLQTGAAEGCFYPISPELVEQVTSHGDVRVVPEASIEQVDGHVGDYRLRVRSAEGRSVLRAGAIVVAVDAEICPLRVKELPGAPAGVLSLRKYGEAVAAGELDGAAACVWLDRDGLDRRCAGQAALSSARDHARRGGRPTLLFRQAPVYGHSGQILYDDARAAGVSAIRYDAAPRFSQVNGSLRVTVSDTVLPEGALEFAVDRLVVPALVRPSDSHARLAALLRQPLDVQGYLQTAIVRMSSIGASALLVQMGLEPVMQMVCRDRNRIAMQSDVFGAYALGVRNMLCLSGDHQKFGNHSGAKNVYDVDSIQLINMVRRMRDEGKVESGDEIDGVPRMFIGAAANPFGDPFAFRAIRLAKKAAAGVDFIQTQCIYDMDKFQTWMRQVVDRGLDRKVHVLAGVTPLKSLGMARYMANNVSGIDVPDALIRRIEGAPKDQRAQEGIRICIEQIQQLRETPGVHGIHLMAIEWEHKVPEIVQGAGLYPRPA